MRVETSSQDIFNFLSVPIYCSEDDEDESGVISCGGQGALLPPPFKELRFGFMRSSETHYVSYMSLIVDIPFLNKYARKNPAEKIRLDRLMRTQLKDKYGDQWIEMGDSSLSGYLLDNSGSNLISLQKQSVKDERFYCITMGGPGTQRKVFGTLENFSEETIMMDKFISSVINIGVDRFCKEREDYSVLKDMVIPI